jgi:hypothetical protein
VPQSVLQDIPTTSLAEMLLCVTAKRGMPIRVCETGLDTDQPRVISVAWQSLEVSIVAG